LVSQWVAINHKNWPRVRLIRPILECVTKCREDLHSVGNRKSDPITVRHQNCEHLCKHEQHHVDFSAPIAHRAKIALGNLIIPCDIVYDTIGECDSDWKALAYKLRHGIVWDDFGDQITVDVALFVKKRPWHTVR
jgi:hypothetical protein